MTEKHYNSYEEWMRAQVDEFTALRDIHHPDYVDIGGYDSDEPSYDEMERRQSMALQKAVAQKKAADKKLVEIQSTNVASIAASATKLTQR